MRQIFTDRANSAEFANVPGGSTGLLCKSWVGKEADQPVYKVDTGLLAELRAHERQAAEERASGRSGPSSRPRLPSRRRPRRWRNV